MQHCLSEMADMKKKLEGFETRQKRLLEVLEDAKRALTQLAHQVLSLNHTPVCGPEILDRNIDG